MIAPAGTVSFDPPDTWGGPLVDAAVAPPTATSDTIRLPGVEGEARTVVRPALAVLFRVAVGPRADAYVPRFLDYERGGGPRAGWHWPAFLAGPVWAFYRKLWIAGIVFSVLPLGGAFAFSSFGGALDGIGGLWWAVLALAVGVVPAVLPALSAHALVYRRVQGAVAEAETQTKSASKAVERLAQAAPVSLAAAIAFGGGALAVTVAALGPPIRAEHEAHATRDALAASLADVRLVQDAVVSAWRKSGTFAHATHVGALLARGERGAVESVTVSPETGRVRVTFGPSVPGAAGKSILLQPAVDDQQRVSWICVPVDIPSRFLPDGCRR